jgi:hypothetical protein
VDELQVSTSGSPDDAGQSRWLVCCLDGCLKAGRRLNRGL